MPLPLRIRTSRRSAGWLPAVVTIAIALGVTGLRMRAVAAPAQGAELQIVSVTPVSSGPICPGTGASFDVDVRNTGGAPATVMLAVMGVGRDLVARSSGTFTIRPGESIAQRVDVEPQPQLIRGGAFRPTLAIVNGAS